MKKVYMQPQTAVFNAEPETLVATSAPIDKTSGDGNGLNSDEILTKQRGEWDIWEK